MEPLGEPRQNNSGEVLPRLSQWLVACLVLLAAFAPGGGVASVAEGPRLAISALKSGYGSLLITADPLGKVMRGLTDPDSMSVGERASWSADGSLLAFAAQPYSTGTRVVGVVGVDGSGLRTYSLAALNAGDPIMAPDGRSVAFARVRIVKVLPGRESYLLKASIWSLDLEDGSVRRLTRWRVGVYLIPSSYSPDGSTLAATSYGSRGNRGVRAVAVDLRSDRTSLLAREAMEPAFSPDGTSFAFVRWKTWRLSGVDKPVPTIDELRIGRVGVAGSQLVLRRRSLSYMAWPGWDPSGRRLTFTLSRADEPGDRSPEEGNRVMAINDDGTCLTEVFSNPDLTLYGAAWQPGPRREAGPIIC